jgi:hypothetical protein
MDILGLITTGRDAKMRALFKEGKASSKDILEIEFGHFPPKGIDYQPTNNLDREVGLKSIGDDKKLKGFSKFFATVASLGYVHGKENIGASATMTVSRDENIYINTMLFNPIAKSLIAMSGASMVAGFAAALTTPLGIFAFMQKHLIFSTMAIATSLRQMPFVEYLTLPFRSFSDVVGHEHVHVLQIHDDVRAKTGLDLSDDPFKEKIVEGQKEFTFPKNVIKLADKVLSLGISS